MATATRRMRKIINEPDQVVKESLAGLAASVPDILRYDVANQILVRGGCADQGQGRADLGRRLRARAAARWLRRRRHARRGVPGRGLHVAGPGPDARRHQGGGRWRRRHPHRQELHR